MDAQALSELSVVVPNLHWRYSGVTATNRAVAPVIARHLGTAWLGSHAPPGVARLAPRNLFRLRVEPKRKSLIWHARRNDEMVVGLLLKWLGWPFKLVFTSAGQRRH